MLKSACPRQVFQPYKQGQEPTLKVLHPGKLLPYLIFDMAEKARLEKKHLRSFVQNVSHEN